MNKALRDEVMKLTPAERLDLIGELCDSLEETDLPPLTSEQIEELDRRLEAHRRDPSRAVPWKEAMERIRAGFK